MSEIEGKAAMDSGEIGGSRTSFKRITRTKLEAVTLGVIRLSSGGKD